MAFLFPFFGLGKVEASAGDRALALATPTLEHLDDPEAAVTFVAGGKQTRGALPVRTARLDGALYSSRGRGYARYNEDGAALFADEAGELYAAVFDQAGGLGGVVRGAGSGVAARHAARAFRRLATGAGTEDIPKTLVEDAIMGAHRELVGRQEGEVTTAVLAVTRGDTVHLMNSGDSAAFHFDARGRHLGQTRQHEHPTPYGIGALTHAVGLEPEGPNAEAYAWTLSPGHWVLMASDGLLDSGLGPDEWGQTLVSAAHAEAGVNELVQRVLRRMTLMQAKPDNLTVVAFRQQAVAP